MLLIRDPGVLLGEEGGELKASPMGVREGGGCEGQ